MQSQNNKINLFILTLLEKQNTLLIGSGKVTISINTMKKLTLFTIFILAFSSFGDENTLTDLLKKVVKSSHFKNYKGARGLQYLKPSLTSLKVAKLNPEDKKEYGREFTHLVTAEYKLEKGNICTLFVPVANLKKSKDNLKFGAGSSDGGCGE